MNAERTRTADDANPVELIVVGHGGIDLGHEEARLAASLIAVNVARHGEPRLQHLKQGYDRPLIKRDKLRTSTASSRGACSSMRKFSCWGCS